MIERYARHVHIPHWDQGKLSAATVVVVGVGGLGTEVTRLLAQSGVGRLVLCDPDLVETSNLNRGSLFVADHVGEPKVRAAAKMLRTVAPETVVDERQDDFRYGIGLGELRTADLVVGCLDSVADRIVLSGRCILAGSPRGLLDAGLHPWGGEVRLFTPDGPCYACGCSPSDRALPGWHLACGPPSELGASAPVVALVAAMQATHAVRLLFDEPVPGGIVRIDAPAGQSRPVTQRRDPGCPCHRVIDPERITRTPLTREATVAELLAQVRPDEQVQSWNPIDRTDALSPLTLRAADPADRLRDLGIPSAEILPVIRTTPTRQVRYLELAGV